MMGGNNSAGVAIVGIACRFPGAAWPGHLPREVRAIAPVGRALL
jgi:hypothetical protein